MRAIFQIFCFCFLGSFAIAQNITTAEYYFDDNDNGLGLNDSFSITSMSQSESIDISMLSEGFHDFHIRVFDQDGNEGAGAWSHYDRVTFYIGNFLTGQTITDVRYRIDNGANNTLGITTPAMSISQSYQISIGSLPQGFHSLYIETQDADGTWSHYDRITFYISEFPSGQNIIAYRYRIDDGSDIAGQETLSPGAPSINEGLTVEVAGLSEGFHSFYVETQAADGTWSLYDRQTFFISDIGNMPADVVEAEYFIDEDPGFGMGESFDPSIVPLLATTDMSITPGDHLFCVRVRNANGDWSLYCCAIFNVDPTVSIDENLYKSTSVFPNPFVDNLQIRTDQSEAIESAIVFDLTGKIIFRSESAPTKLELGYLEQGTYLLKLVTASKEAIFKIVKQ